MSSITLVLVPLLFVVENLFMVSQILINNKLKRREAEGREAGKFVWEFFLDVIKGKRWEVW